MASWFTGLAEKAENLLVAVDQSAADALHSPSPKKRPEFNEINSDCVLPIVMPSPSNPSTSNSSLNLHKSLHASSSNSTWSSPSYSSVPKKKEIVEDDDTLISYLNSPNSSFHSTTWTYNNETMPKTEEIKKLEAQISDLRSLLSAKDSQLAVLRVRLQEADQDISSKRMLIDELTTENESLMKDQSGNTNATLQSLREQLREAETELKSKQESLLTIQSELQERIKLLEKENKKQAQELAASQQQLHKEKLRWKELEGQYTLALENAEAATQELQEYKQRAQMILQSKDKLISSLKDSSCSCQKKNVRCTLDLDDDGWNGRSLATEEQVSVAQQERLLLKQELEHAQAEVASLKSQLHSLETSSSHEKDALQTKIDDLEKRLHESEHSHQRAEMDCQHYMQELELVQDRLKQVSLELRSEITAKDSKIEQLKQKLSARSWHSADSDHSLLEKKVQQLTENLIKKQTVVEALSTDKNSLTLQVERLEQQLAEAQKFQEVMMREPQRNRPNGFKSGFPRLYPASPYDSIPKRMYKGICRSLDNFSFHLGLFYNRYPHTSTLTFIYMVFLQLWVIIILVNYQLEIHNVS